MTPIEPAGFRRLLGHFVTGVTVVSTTDPSGRPVGMTVSSLASVSLAPPLLLICIDQAATVHDTLVDAAHFAVNVLREGQVDLARRFAESGNGRADDAAWRPSAGGAPILDGVLAWIRCERTAVHPGGDHSIIVGRVLEGAHTEGTPLLHYRGGYRTLGAP